MSTKRTKEPKNIRDLPWFEEEDLERVPGVNGVLILPDLEEVLQEAQKVFESATKIEQQRWQTDQEFLARTEVRQFLRSLMSAYQRLKESASHTTVFCEWKDAHGNVCGSKMDIAVDAFGAYYRCQLDQKTHRTPK